MRNNRNYYQILHVQQNAPVEVIRSSYRTMMQRLKMHPDLGGDHEEAAIVNQAYAVLTNAKKRADYDASLEKPAENDSQATEVKSKSPTSNTIYNQDIDTAKSCSFCQSAHSFGEKIEPDCVCNECGSTLFPAVKQVLEKDDQRIIQRIDKQWPVTFFTQWPDAIPYVGQTQDVSLNGIQIVTSVYMQEGQFVKMNSQMLDAVARVMNSREDYNEGTKIWRVGLEFITLRFYRTQGTFIQLDI